MTPPPEVDRFVRDHPALLEAETERYGYLGYDKFIERLVTDLRGAISELEREAELYQDDDEEKLTALIAKLLRQKSYQATREENARGHSDLQVKNDDPLRVQWLAEAKIWRGVGWLKKGLDELLDRYSTGRDANNGLLIYIKVRNALERMKKWEQALTASPRTLSVGPTPHTFELASRHRHGAGTDMHILHLGVQLHYSPPGGAKPRRRKGKAKPSRKSKKAATPKKATKPKATKPKKATRPKKRP